MYRLVQHDKLSSEPLKGSSGVYSKTLATSADWPAMSVHELSMQPGSEVALHSHDKQSELHYILRGRAIGRIGDTSYRMEAGDALLVEGQTLHGLANDGDEELVVLCVFSPPLS